MGNGTAVLGLALEATAAADWQALGAAAAGTLAWHPKSDLAVGVARALCRVLREYAVGADSSPTPTRGCCSEARYGGRENGVDAPSEPWQAAVGRCGGANFFSKPRGSRDQQMAR